MDIYSKLKSSIYVSRLHAQGIGVEDDDQRIRASGLYDDWTPGSYVIGDLRNAAAGGALQTWECFQAHDNAVYPDIRPESAAWFTFWRPLHGKSPETARPFVPVQGSHDMYRYDEYMIWTDGLVYRCIAPSGTNFSPADYPAGWEVVS